MLRRDKAPGLGGFSPYFSQECWSFVKGDLLSQGAFAAGWQIVDLVLVANEVVEDYILSGKEGDIIKIHFEKAYDNVEWTILDFVMERGIRGHMEKMDFELSCFSFIFSVNQW